MPKVNLKLEIAEAAQNAVHLIAAASAEAAKAIAAAASEAKQVVANNAATAAQVLVTKNIDGISDHEVLSTFVATTTLNFANLDTKFTEKFADIKNDIAKISDGTSRQINDQEVRIKALETWRTARNEQIKDDGLKWKIIFGLGILILGMIVYHLTGYHL